MAPTEPADVRLYGAMDYAVSTLRAVAPRVSSFPQLTAYERWVYRDHGGWVGGFWPGQLWLACTPANRSSARWPSAPPGGSPRAATTRQRTTSASCSTRPG